MDAPAFRKCYASLQLESSDQLPIAGQAHVGFLIGPRPLDGRKRVAQVVEGFFSAATSWQSRTDLAQRETCGTGRCKIPSFRGAILAQRSCKTSRAPQPPRH